MQIGDIVMDKDDMQPRSQWKLGRILDTVKDTDGLVRKVKIGFADINLTKMGQRVNKMSVVEWIVKGKFTMLKCIEGLELQL